MKEIFEEIGSMLGMALLVVVFLLITSFVNYLAGI
jgi:hypothetical protein